MDYLFIYTMGFSLVLIRLSAFFLTVPLFSYRTIPSMLKIGIATFFAIIISIQMDFSYLENTEAFFYLAIRETLIGLSIGLVAFIIITAIQVAGGFIDFQMGFAIANVIDPQTGTQSPLIGQYLYIFALLVLLILDGHHLILDGIFYSYEFIPLEKMVLNTNFAALADFVARVFGQMFIIAFQMAVPLVGCLFLVDLSLGIMARTVPQLNVFVVGLPLKILVSFIVLILTMGSFYIVLKKLFYFMFQVMRSLMEIIGGV